MNFRVVETVAMIAIAGVATFFAVRQHSYPGYIVAWLLIVPIGVRNRSFFSRPRMFPLWLVMCNAFLVIPAWAFG